MEDCTICSRDDRGPLARIDVRGHPVRHIKMELTPDAYGRFKLQPAETRPKKFLKIVLMAIVWNALTAAAIYAVVSQWKGGAQYLAAVVLFVFALIGLMMLWSIFYQFILLFGPRPSLTINSNNLRFGGRADINWSFTMPQLIRTLEFWLDLEEDEKEAKSSEDRVCLYAVDKTAEAARGQISIQLPEKSPKPFITSRKITYILKLKANIKYLPDIDQDYLLLLSE
jgi:hypothetical protein